MRLKYKFDTRTHYITTLYVMNDKSVMKTERNAVKFKNAKYR